MRPLALLVCAFSLFFVRPAAAQLQIPPPSDEMPYAYSNPVDDEDAAVHTVLISMATVTTMGFNLSDHPPGWAGAAGFIAGTLQVVYGTRFDEHPVASTVNYFIGGAAILTSLSALSRGGGERTTQAVHVTPLLAWDDERRPLAGASLRF